MLSFFGFIVCALIETSVWIVQTHNKNNTLDIGVSNGGLTLSKATLNELSVSMGAAVGKVLIADQIRRSMDHISVQNTVARQGFRDSIINYYGFRQWFCMVCGHRNLNARARAQQGIRGMQIQNRKFEGTHIVQASASHAVVKLLNTGYDDDFDESFPRNGLLLCEQCNEWFVCRKFVIIYDGIGTGKYRIVPISNVCGMFKDKFLKFPVHGNDKRYYTEVPPPKKAPYRRALKFHFIQCLQILTTAQQEKYGFGGDNGIPWRTIAELSDKDSKADDDDVEDRWINEDISQFIINKFLIDTTNVRGDMGDRKQADNDEIDEKTKQYIEDSKSKEITLDMYECASRAEYLWGLAILQAPLFERGTSLDELKKEEKFMHLVEGVVNYVRSFEEIDKDANNSINFKAFMSQPRWQQFGAAFLGNVVAVSWMFDDIYSYYVNHRGHYQLTNVPVLDPRVAHIADGKEQESQQASQQSAFYTKLR